MARIIIDDYGTKIYYDAKGKVSRKNGPAIIDVSGSRYWFINGNRDSKVNPCEFTESGNVAWAWENRYQRENGPALDLPNGAKFWYNRGSFWPEL